MIKGVDKDGSRRRFLAGITGVATAVGLGLGLGTLARSPGPSARSPVKGRDEPNDAWIETADTPVEDLMREHAVLERVLLVYEEGARRLERAVDVSPDIFAKAAHIIRRYIEDHHERDEENHVFPRLERIGAEVALCATLRAQHDAGRRLTGSVLRLATLDGVRDRDRRAELAGAMRLFVRMYRPHAAHENTVLFPAFRRAVSQREYETLQANLEKAEHAALGEHLYEEVIDEVRGLERALGIGDLTAFTPA